MTLKLQVQSIVFCLSYGLFISLTFNFLYIYMFYSRLIIKMLSSIIYVLLISTIFFYFLILINNGILNNYFILFTILGFIIGNNKTKRIRFYLNRKRINKNIKTWYLTKY